MLVCFYDSKKMIHHEFALRDRDKLSLEIFECSGTPMEEDSPCPAPSSWFLVHDNASVHQAVAVQECLARKQVHMLHHPPYSPDLSPSDYFLFLKQVIYH